MKRIVLILFFVLPLLNTLRAQQVNAYATVTNIAGKVLTLSNIDETVHTFTAGENIIIMQMQDNVIGSNTSNNSSFGNLGSINSAGLYDFYQIQSRTATTITLATNLSQTYNINANSVVQVISFRKYGSPNYTTTANMSAKTWNGNTGGVLAIDVAGTLTIAHTLSANGSGFNGGSASNNYSNATCDSTIYLAIANRARNGSKGQGIYLATNIDYLRARGKLINGGGGASSARNGGGGGGGNYSAGGDGGPGWSGSAVCSPGTGGLGGLSLSSNISSSRIFMGGGGGGGQQDNTAGTAGANGGGIILVRASTIQTTGTCTARITANGSTAGDGGLDGSGGGGAGGSIVIQANTWSVVGTCPLTISANGGNGGASNGNTNIRGGGGAGGQGVIIYSSNQPVTNVTTQTNNGSPGCNNNPCTSSATTASGTNNSGIVQNSTGPLPIELLSFDCTVKDNSVNIQWITLSEVNNQYFSIERSIDALNWSELKIIPGSGNKNIPCNYQWIDLRPLNGISYYRLKQVDKDGKYSYSLTRGVEVNTIGQYLIFPNPMKDLLEIRFPTTVEEITIEILNDSGQMIGSYTLKHQDLAQIDLSQVVNGVYFARIKTSREEIIKKFIKEQ